MKDLLKLILGIPASLFKSRAKLEAEILILRRISVYTTLASLSGIVWRITVLDSLSKGQS